jgi:hypothetical protein
MHPHTQSFAVSRRQVVASVKGAIGGFQQLSFDLMLGANDTLRQQMLEARRILRQFGYEVDAVLAVNEPAVQ